jgi:hypothetical protein
MAININAPSPIAEENESLVAKIQKNFGAYVVTPLNAFGLGGFIFDVEGETSITLSADITDHFLEDNVAIQDHIGIRPQRVTLRSYVGELVYQVDSKTNTVLQKVVQKLTVLNAYLPALSNAAQQIQSSLSLASQSFTSGEIFNLASSALRPPNLNNIVDLWALTKNLNPAASKQQQAYLYFKALQEQKILVSLQTPFEFVTNMAIETIVATQDETTRNMSDFSLTLKKIRTVAVNTVSFDPNKYQNRSQQQAQNTSEQGNNQGGQEPMQSLLFKMRKNLGDLF